MEATPSMTHTQLMGVVWGGVGVAIILTAFRYYIRFKFFGRLYVDDAFVFLALVLLMASAIMYHFITPTLFLLNRIVAGQTPPPPDLQQVITTYLKVQFALTLLFWTGLWAVKFSFLAFFYKLGQGLRAQRIAWMLVVVFTALAFVGCLISYPIACSSFKAGDCNDQLHVQRSLISLRYSTAIDILSDALIIVLPINLLVRVKINLREKAALTFIFSLGAIIMVFALVRVIKTNSTHNHPDTLWLALWSAIESSIAIIVSCLASFKTLISRSGESQRYVYPTDACENSPRRRAFAMGTRGQNSVTVHGGSSRRPPANSNATTNTMTSMAGGSVMDDASLDEEFVGRKQHGVHVQTDFEVTRSD
ncbi:MAG: hypothetical protein M1826_001698 [Phylliscum demangeonii]|nr:MAG: hypothetical protein M1826_001698 [Phylliscum demangeonii]